MIPIVPDIAVEVLSPSETTRMILRKLKQYFDAGIKEVWLIDPDAKAEIWTGPQIPDHELTGDNAVTSALLPLLARTRRTIRLIGLFGTLLCHPRVQEIERVFVRDLGGGDAFA